MDDRWAVFQGGRMVANFVTEEAAKAAAAEVENTYADPEMAARLSEQRFILGLDLTPALLVKCLPTKVCYCLAAVQQESDEMWDRFMIGTPGPEA